MSGAHSGTRRRVRARIEGTVQGVGFRPYVYRLALELGLAGYVLNDALGVLCEAEGEPAAVEAFLARLPAQAPALAAVERVSTEAIAATGGDEFEIRSSESSGEPLALVSPDMATCDECLQEVFDPSDRRHRYPFTNCTNCGPRFTIVRGVPYDRPQTTMSGFEMCGPCSAEYADPLDRRFHAQPNACPDCGPRVWLADRDGAELPLEGSRDAIAAAAKALLEGRIVALKGIGGFHLACRADDDQAVTALRSRKHREDRPFALMTPDLEAALKLVELSEAEARLVTGRERPIVIARRTPDAPVAGAVAPGTPDLGVMLPYSPLHHLLLRDAGTTLVMTSGNVSDEPIAFGDGDGLVRLAGIADLFLLGSRPIHMRTDDSVLRATRASEAGSPLLIRRSRGYVPGSLDLPIPTALPLLACGAELKSTFCVAKGRRAWVSHHIGDLTNYETLRSYEHGIEHFKRLFAVEPELVAHDLHPEYLSTRHAMELEGEAELLPVQHHHAHMAAVLAEHGETGRALGAIFDGTGYGPDNTAWGGELLAGDLTGFERVGLLWPVRLPGGDRAAREPWRMACAWLSVLDGENRPQIPANLAGEVGEPAWNAVCEMIRTGVGSPLTTSAGRLFDGMAALCGLRMKVNYEGQAAIELEAAADPSERGGYELPLIDARSAADRSDDPSDRGEGPVILDARELVRGAIADLSSGAGVAVVSARFHNGLAEGTAAACEREARRLGLDLIVLSGGVFQNRLLIERTTAALRTRGLRVLIPERLPPNDGGIAYGQAAIAAAQIESFERAARG